MNKISAAVLFVLSLSALFISACHIPIDEGISAAEGHDATAVLTGCGKRADSGYLFCRVTEKKDPTLTMITLHIPKIDSQHECDKDSCADFMIFRKDGTPGYSAGIPKGQTYVTFALSDVLGSEEMIADADDGEHLIGVKIYFKDNDGYEDIMLGHAFIRISVMKEGYAPVGCEDPNIAFYVKIKDGCSAQFTTNFRTAICGVSCEE